MKKSDQTKHFIVEKSAEIFNQKGYNRTSLLDITKVTGLTKGAIYGNFKNKNEVSNAAFIYNTQKLFSQLKSEMNIEISTAEKLKAFLNFYQTNWQKINQNGGCPLLKAATELEDSFPELDKSVKKSFEVLMHLINKTIEDGIQSDECKENISTQELSIEILCLLEGGLALSKTYDSEKYLQLVCRRISQIIQHEILK